MVKISIGNLSEYATTDELQSLFSRYGKVAGCTIVKNSGFVYMDNKVEAEEAIRSLLQHELHGQPMTVELSRGKSKGSAKLHIGNISCTNQELRAKFEEFGNVLECDIVKSNATLHMERLEDAMEAIDKMHNATFKGKLMTIQLSTSRPRTPGHTGCYLCGKHGHFSKDCPFSLNGSPSGWTPPCGPPSKSRGSYGRTSLSPSPHMGGPPLSRASHGGGLLPTPRGPSGYSSELGDRYWSREPGYYPERSSAYECHHLNSSADYYAQPYGSNHLEDSRISSPLLPLPSSAGYFARDHSPIRRVPSADYAKRSRPPLSPSRSAYATSRPRDHYMSRYAPY